MKTSAIIEYDGYQLKNYTILTDIEQDIALEFRNKNRKWMATQDIIKIEDHKDWINSLSDNCTILYYLVFKDGIPFMTIYYHDINLKKKEAYWGYSLGNQEFKSEVLKIEKMIIDIAFNKFNFDKLLCINNVENHVINIHKFFGFQEDGIVTINGQDFLKMFLLKEC